MDADKSDDFFPNLRNPEGTQIINDRCMVKTQDGHCLVIVSGIVLAQFASADRMAEAYAMVHLVEQGWARQQEVARVFGCSARTVRRDQQRFEDGGLAALGCGSGYPKGRWRLPAAHTGLIDQLKAQGHSNREIARRVGVSEMAIRKVLRGLGGFITGATPCPGGTGQLQAAPRINRKMGGFIPPSGERKTQTDRVCGRRRESGGKVAV
jgi:transposase